MSKDTGKRFQVSDSNDGNAITVTEVNKSFRLPHNRQSSLKGTLVNLISGGDRTFETQEVLKDVTFEIKKGEFFGIVGRNGSGKSTLLKMLAGIYKPTTGEISVNGSLTPFIELGVGFNPELTGRENVFLNGALLGFNDREVRAMYADIVAFAELKRFMDQKLKNYSSGMQVRLAFSIAIRARSDILLLDEVLAVGDAAFQQKCFTYFEELKRLKRTVIIVSHDMSAITRFCSRAIYIKDGTLLAQGNPADIADVYAKENISSESVQVEEPKVEPDKNQPTVPLDSQYKISARIIHEDDKWLSVEFDYKAMLDIEMYIGLSIAREGVSVAEITTSPSVLLKKIGHATYKINKIQFNAGAYTIGAGLYGIKNRELLAVTNKRQSFTVKGRDLTKGGALRLDDTWEY